MVVELLLLGGAVAALLLVRQLAPRRWTNFVGNPQREDEAVVLDVGEAKAEVLLEEGVPRQQPVLHSLLGMSKSPSGQQEQSPPRSRAPSSHAKESSSSGRRLLVAEAEGQPAVQL